MSETRKSKLEAELSTDPEAFIRKYGKLGPSFTNGHDQLTPAAQPERRSGTERRQKIQVLCGVNGDIPTDTPYFRRIEERRESPVSAEATKPAIVCLCGSTRFWEAFRDYGLKFTLEGKIVLSIGICAPDSLTFAHPEPGTDGEEIKRKLDVLHKRKIDLCDEVFVLNVGGYIGNSTRSEIVYAKRHGKPVYWLEPHEHYEGQNECEICDVPPVAPPEAEGAREWLRKHHPYRTLVSAGRAIPLAPVLEAYAASKLAQKEAEISRLWNDRQRALDRIDEQSSEISRLTADLATVRDLWEIVTDQGIVDQKAREAAEAANTELRTALTKMAQGYRNLAELQLLTGPYAEDAKQYADEAERLAKGE